MQRTAQSSSPPLTTMLMSSTAPRRNGNGTKSQRKRRGQRIQIGMSLIKHQGQDGHASSSAGLRRSVTQPPNHNTVSHRRPAPKKRTLTATSILKDWDHKKEALNAQQRDESFHAKPAEQQGHDVSKASPFDSGTAKGPSANAHHEDDDSSSSSSSSSSASSNTTITDSQMKHNNNNPPETKDDFLRREMEALADSDDEEVLLSRGDREPLRPGDVISYYNPAFVYGSAQGYRVTRVSATHRHGRDGCLELDNGEFLPSDTRVLRRRRRGRHGVPREIRHFRLRTRHIVSDPGRSRRAVLQRAGEDLRKASTEIWKDVQEKVEQSHRSASSCGSSNDDHEKVTRCKRHSASKPRQKRGARLRENSKESPTDMQASRANPNKNASSSVDPPLKRISTSFASSLTSMPLAAHSIKRARSENLMHPNTKQNSKSHSKAEALDRSSPLPTEIQRTQGQQSSDDSDDDLLLEPVFKTSSNHVRATRRPH